MVHEGGWQLVKGDGNALLAIPPTTGFMNRLPAPAAPPPPEPALIASG